MKSDFIAAQLDVARLQAALSDSDGPNALHLPELLASSYLIAMQRHFLAKQVDEFRAKLASLDSQRAQKRRRKTLRSRPASANSKRPNRLFNSGWKSKKPWPTKD